MKFEELPDWQQRFVIEYKELLENPEYLEKIYTEGAEKARELASKTLDEVKSKIGILQEDI